MKLKKFICVYVDKIDLQHANLKISKQILKTYNSYHTIIYIIIYLKIIVIKMV